MYGNLKWQVIYSGYAETSNVPTGVVAMSAEEFKNAVRANLPKELSDIIFEVDVAAKDSRATNPMQESSEITFYDPLLERYSQSNVLDLFRRLPTRIALFRVYAPTAEHRQALIASAESVLNHKVYPEGDLS